LKEQLRFLIELQKDDLAAARINGKKRELPEALGRLTDEFTAAEARLGEDRRQLEEMHKRHREKESKLKGTLDLVRKTKDRLSEVKTNKEYQAMLKEIEAIEKKRSETEDEIISCLDDIEQAEQDLKVREKEFEAVLQRYEQERRRLEEEIRNLDTELLAAQQRIRTIRKQVREDVLKRYEVIKNRHNGLAVVSVWKEVCNGCHMNMPPQLYNDLQKSLDILTCPNCNRIIYWYKQDAHD
jgi:uncharacterized protein